MSERIRFNFLVDEDNGFFVVRPIGNLSPDELVDAIISAYQSIDKPWRFNRIIDFRRYKGVLDIGFREAVGTRWAEMTAGIDYHAHAAVVFRSAHEKVRVPEVLKEFPKETHCYFTDYHEAVGWLLAPDRVTYLQGLPELPAGGASDSAIRIE